MFYGGQQVDKMQRRYRKHYSADGSMEITHDTQSGKTTFVTYIGGDAYSAPAIWREEYAGSTTVKKLYYLHRDYLGSILAITDQTGALKEKRHFDAWGNIVKLTDGSGAALDYFVILDRGYTGHEHLFGVGLIHMNGRLYDPVLHRFLSPDNYVQDPFNTQSFNRFGYALNNPLMYTDPDGEFFWIAVGVGALIGAITQAVKPDATFWKIVGGAIIGGAGGAIGAGVGNIVAGGTFFGSQIAATVGFWAGAASGAAGGFAGGFVGGAGSAWLGGASFGEGLGAGLMAGGIGGLTGGLINGISSGIRHSRQMRMFRSGLDDMGITSGDPLPATDDFLKKAQRAWFPDAEMNKIKVFSTEHLDKVVAKDFATIGGAGRTVPLAQKGVLTGYSEVYFNSAEAFKSARDLFGVMGHELLHASQFAALKGESIKLVATALRDMIEFHGYSYEAILSPSFNVSNFSTTQVKEWITNFPRYFQLTNYTNFGWARTANFKYPF